MSVVYSRWIHPDASAELEAIIQAAPPEETLLLIEAARLLTEYVRTDAHLKGIPSSADPTFRESGFDRLKMFWWLGPEEDRYVKIVGFVWTPV